MALLTEHGSGASEYDANSALAELDRASRSNNIGEKAELIVRVPTYFEKYPFPIFVNAVFLKLTELFRSSTTNFLRKLILQVAERSEPHLDKIISCEEISKRVMTVSYSNDPVARAITLRLLGCLANVLSDQKQIHHLIRISLDSHDNDELFAAIFSAEKFAQHSTEFANAISEKVAEMLGSVEVVSSTKIALLPILQHVHNDPHTTEKVFELCQKLMEPNSHDPDFVCSILRTLTGLSMSSLIIFTPQMELLFTFLTDSHDASVKIIAAKCLERMAKGAPQFWDRKYFEQLLLIIRKFEFNRKIDNLLICCIFQIMSATVCNQTITAWGPLDDAVNNLLKICAKFVVSPSVVKLIAPFSQILANLLYTADYSQLSETIPERTVFTLTNFLPLWSPIIGENQPKNVAHFQVFGRSLVKICSRFKSHTALVCHAINLAAKTMPESMHEILFLTICSLNDCDSISLTSVINLPEKFANISTKLDLMLLPAEFPPSSNKKLANQDYSDGWEMYKIARFASRFGRHRVAANLFGKLKDMVVSDYNYHWLKFLDQMSQAESMLSDEKVELDQIVSAYNFSLFYLKVGSTPTHSLWFPVAYMDLRVQFLTLVRDILAMWKASKQTPPPTASLLSTDRRAKFSQFLNWVTCYLNKAEILAGDFEALRSKCFDTDKHTLEHMTLETLKVLAICQWLTMILDEAEYSESFISFDDSLSNACNRNVWKFIKSTLAKMETAYKKCVDIFGIEILESIMQSVENLARFPLYMPRYVFQALQCTTIKTVLSPQPTGSDQAISLLQNQGLVLKVEGVIQHVGSKSSKIRRVAQVVLTVKTEFLGIPSASDQKTISTEQLMEKYLTPHNDYFSAEFLLHFTQHASITVRSDVVDGHGCLWKLGVEEKLKVKLSSGSV